MSDKLEHCTVATAEKTCKMMRHPGDSVGWFSSVRMNQPVSQIVRAFECLIQLNTAGICSENQLFISTVLYFSIEAKILI